MGCLESEVSVGHRKCAGHGSVWWSDWTEMRNVLGMQVGRCGCHDCSRASFYLAFHLLGFREFILTLHLKDGFLNKKKKKKSSTFRCLWLNFGVRFPPTSVADSFFNVMTDEDLAMRLHTGAVWGSWNI